MTTITIIRIFLQIKANIQEIRLRFFKGELYKTKDKLNLEYLWAIF